MPYINNFHRRVAEMDLGIYNWKQHSTGYLLDRLRHCNPFHGWRYESEWYLYNEADPVDKHKHEVFWYKEWAIRLRNELAKRPHQSTKRERKKNIGK